MPSKPNAYTDHPMSMSDIGESLAACASEMSPIGLKLGDPGVFLRENRARVFWLGIDDADKTGKLKMLSRCCRQAGHATLRKRTAKEEPFRGHITLARRRGFPASLAAEGLAEMPQPPEAEWTANRLVLFQSELHRSGARYRLLEAFEFLIK